MIKRFCSFTFIFLLLFCSLTSTVFASPDYVKVYHPVINKAELLITDKKYKEALASYIEAFAAVPSPFAKDYYNALVCATLVKDEKQAYTYLQKLAIKGVSLAYLRRQAVFDSLQTTKAWSKFERKYPRYRRAYKRKANLDLRADLDELYARDQYYRQSARSLRAYGDTLPKIEADNVVNFLNWVDKHGYPGEAVIGVADTLEQLPRFSIVILRQRKAANGYDFTPVLQEAVHKGRLMPQVAAYLMEQQAGQNRFNTRAFVKVNCANPEDCAKDRKLLKARQLLVEKMTKKEMEHIEKERAGLGLEPTEHYRKKVLYSLKDNRFKLHYTWSVTNYFVPSKEAAKVMLEGLVVADN